MAELTDLIIRDCCECDRPEKYDVDTVELRVSDLRLIIDRHLASLLPSSYYMDPPDGGDVSVSEQLVRMAADAAKWRARPVRGLFGSTPDGGFDDHDVCEECDNPVAQVVAVYPPGPDGPEVNWLGKPPEPGTLLYLAQENQHG